MQNAKTKNQLEAETQYSEEEETYCETKASSIHEPDEDSDDNEFDWRDLDAQGLEEWIIHVKSETKLAEIALKALRKNSENIPSHESNKRKRSSHS